MDRLVLSIEEAADALGISSDVVYRETKSGRIPTVRLGRRLVVPKQALEEMLASAGVPAEEPVPTA